MELKFRPIGDHLLLKKVNKPISTTIIIPDAVEVNEPIIAKVLAVGPRVKANIVPGNYVLGHKYMDKVVGKINTNLGNNIFITTESEILAILEDYNE